jgi:hypothetical protein
MANMNMGQVLTCVQGMPLGAPVTITAGALLSLVQQLQTATGSQPTVPFYATPDGSPPPFDLTQFPGV